MVVTHPTTGKQITIGADVPNSKKLKPVLEKVENEGCDFIVVPLYHPRFDEGNQPNPVGAAKTLNDLKPFCRPETELAGGEWAAGVVGKVNPWLRLDSPIDKLRRFSESLLLEEVAFANYVGLQSVVIPLPELTSGTKIANFARCICAALQTQGFTQILIRVPLYLPASEGGSEVNVDPWDHWNYIRSLAANHPNLGIALEMSMELPSKPALERWLAEPVHIFMIDRGSFVANKAGYPVLHKRQQDFLRAMFRYRPMICITGAENNKIKTDAGYRVYVQYLAHLFGKQPPGSDSEQFQEPFHDFLQPLDMPFKANLDSQTFDVMDRDPVKYARYGEAITQFFQDRPMGDDAAAVVVVIGAGRGAMVAKVLEVAANCNRKVRVYALEKNPNAIVALQNMRIDQNWNNVFVVPGDPRLWESGTRVDLVVSEMIGAFGDNELLPEYIDALSRVMKDECVVIPSCVTSFLAPITSPKLMNEVRLLGTARSKFEKPYLVAMNRAQPLSPAQPCFEFQLPWRPEMSSASPIPTLDRTECLSFGVPESVQLHGFAGYFEARLYNDIIISTVPESYSHGMLSWFSVYFPLSKPIVIPGESFCQVQFWRRSEKGKIWYEWCLLAPEVLPMHNPNGRSFSVQSL